MSKLVRAIFEAIKESRPVQEIGAELKQQLAHGAHELAAALFHGNAFVMYPRQGDAREDSPHVLPPETGREQERGGREM